MKWSVAAGDLLGRFWRWIRREPSEVDLLIVRKGLSPAYYFFCKMFAQERGLQMVLDRRRESRRRRQRATSSIDRRNQERRQPESQLDKDDFCVVKGQRVTTAKTPVNPLKNDRRRRTY